ncbi:MAG: hypothetical protein M1828_000545 [Chrysothrix sp. TS-e1954]|nr:MAG: hypothetical protein M1828_000545 [Chrysothrix sp. TS-e1954]
MASKGRSLSKRALADSVSVPMVQDQTRERPDVHNQFSLPVRSRSPLHETEDATPPSKRQRLARECKAQRPQHPEQTLGQVPGRHVSPEITNYHSHPETISKSTTSRQRKRTASPGTNDNANDTVSNSASTRRSKQKERRTLDGVASNGEQAHESPNSRSSRTPKNHSKNQATASKLEVIDESIISRAEDSASDFLKGAVRKQRESTHMSNTHGLSGHQERHEASSTPMKFLAESRKFLDAFDSELNGRNGAIRLTTFDELSKTQLTNALERGGFGFDLTDQPVFADSRSLRSKLAETLYIVGATPKQLSDHLADLDETLFPKYYEALREMGSPGDCCVITNRNVFLVHRSIVSQVEWFRTELEVSYEYSATGLTTCYNLDEQSPAFPSIFEFMYTGGYSELQQLESPQIPNGRQDSQGSLMVLHAEIFVLADRYGMDQLKLLAARKFLTVVNPLLDLSDVRVLHANSTAFLYAVENVYTNVPASRRQPIQNMMVKRTHGILLVLLQARPTWNLKDKEDNQPHVMGREWSEEDYEMCEGALAQNRVLMLDNPEFSSDLVKYAYAVNSAQDSDASRFQELVADDY